MTIERWPEFMKKNRRSQDPPPARLLALDPGETTGWAYFRFGLLAARGQIRVSPGHLLPVAELIGARRPEVIVMEDYKVYAHRAAQHVGSTVPTIQVIGAIRLTAESQGIDLHTQMAYQAKGFCQDRRLVAWGLYEENKRHSNDAVRHGCYYLLFHRSVPVVETGELAR